MSSRPVTSRRIRTFSGTNAMALDNQVNDHLEYLARNGAEVVSVTTSAVQAGTLLTYIATVHYITAT